MTITIGQIIAALPSLSPAELAQVGATVAHLSQQSAPTGRASPLYAAVTTVLGSQVPYTAFARSAVHEHWQKNASTVTEFISVNFPEAAASTVLTIAIMRYLVQLLVSDLQRRHIPVSLGTVATHLARIPAVFETAFPGYLAAGRADVVLKAMEQKK